MPKIDWDLTLKLVGIVFTAVGGLYQWRNLRFRSKLKDDLEILKLYGEYGTDNPNYIALKKHVDETVAKAYPHPDAGKPKRADRVGIVLGIANLLGAIVGMFLLKAEGVTWFGLALTVSAAIVGLVLLLTSFRRSDT